MATKKMEQEMGRLFQEESISAARNRLHALAAAKKGDKVLARLLNSIANAEEVHANRALIYLRGNVSDLDAYRSGAADRKKQVSTDTYAGMRQTADLAGDSTAEEIFDRVGRVARNHRQLLQKVGTGDPEIRLYICQICGFIATNDIPDACPVCNAVPKKFKER